MSKTSSYTVTLSDGGKVDEQTQAYIGRLLLYSYKKSVLKNRIEAIANTEDKYGESHKNHILMNRRVELAEVEVQYYRCASCLWELAITNPGLEAFLKELDC